MSDEVNLRTPTYRVPSRGMDPATKRLGLIATALGGALLVLMGGWSVTGHHSGRVPLVAPPAGPMRIKPINPGGMQLSANEDLYSQAHADIGDGKLAPAPEVPDPQALREPPRQEPAAPVASPAVSTVTPVVAPVGKPAGSAVVGKIATHTDPTPIIGHIMVQLAALPTEQAAKDQWALLQHRLPELLHARQLAVSKTEVGGHLWWRVRVGGFTDTTDAKGFCDKVRAKGEVCDVLKS
ncbi:MAG TPA: SPOR domain-containing protein [Acetobacteraceae bacterium]|nr:SPOR domain-containing protein [Acetobacteraceae bacterium]